MAIPRTSRLRRGLARARDVEARLRWRSSRDPVLRLVREAARSEDVEVWVVGGYVRDAALGRAAADADLAAGRGFARLIVALEAGWGRRGFRFRKRGVTTWRFRVCGRDLDVVDAAKRGLEADLRRREFTLNAVAFDLRRGRLFDPLHGLRDLRHGRLRLSRGGVLREDPVRALRAARFLAQLPGLRLDASVRAEIAQVLRPLRRCSAERVRDELNRLLTAPAPVLGLEAADRLGLLGSVLPELLPLERCKAGRERPDVWRHTLDAIAVSERPGRLPGAAALRARDGMLVLRWALLLHDVAKPETLGLAPDGRPTFHGHEVRGARAADALLSRLRQPRSLRRRVRRLILHHLRPHHLSDAGAPPRGMRRLVRDAGDDLPLLLALAACDAKGSGAPDVGARWRRLRLVLGTLGQLHERSRRVTSRPLVDGRDVMAALGIPPGPEVGRLLTETRELQEEGRLLTREDALRHLKTIARRN